MNVKHGRFLVVALVLAILVAMVAPNVLAQRPVRGQEVLSMIATPVPSEGIDELPVFGRGFSLENAVHYDGLAIEANGNSDHPEQHFGPDILACTRFHVGVAVYRTDPTRGNTTVEISPVDGQASVYMSQNMTNVVNHDGMVTATTQFVEDPESPAEIWIEYPDGYLGHEEMKMFTIVVDGQTFQVRVTDVYCPDVPGDTDQTRRIYLPRISTQ